jgi:ABC-type Zn uptake system ZnuABC Zn-binding protein ZnuA
LNSRKTIAAALAACLLAALVAACGSSEDDGSGRPTVTATTAVLADITEQVAGEDAQVEQLIPDSAGPHDFQLSAQDRAGIEDSVLLVSNGAELEQGIPVDEVEIAKFALADHVEGLLPLEDAGAHEEEEHGAEEAEHAEGEEEHAGEEGEHAEEEEHGHGTVDPHVWMDPTRVAGALPALAEALAEADPDNAEGYRARATKFGNELTALDAEIQAQLEAIPPANRELVTSHDALGYFADRYGFEVVATPFPASGAEAEASAGRIDEVEQAIRRTGVPTVFAEEGDDPEVLSLIAGETGVKIDEGLLVEAPGSAGTYVEMLRNDAQIVLSGLR